MDSLRKPHSNFVLSILFIAICFLFTFCDDENDVNVKQPSLIGKWKLVEQKVGIGPPGEWTDVVDGGVFEFNDDYSFVNSYNPHCANGSYEINKDLLILSFECPEYNEVWDYKIIEFKKSSMIVTPATVFCSEGCYSRYQKIF